MRYETILSMPRHALPTYAMYVWYKGDRIEPWGYKFAILRQEQNCKRDT